MIKQTEVKAQSTFYSDNKRYEKGFFSMEQVKYFTKNSFKDGAEWILQEYRDNPPFNIFSFLLGCVSIMIIFCTMYLFL